MDLRLLLNNKEVEIDGTVIAPLTYAIADIKNPSVRTRNRSKTIKIKGTQNNNALMYASYSLSLDDINGIGFDFNPNAEITAQIYRNSHLIFDGVANLIDVEIIDKVKYFNVQIYGTAVGLFDLFGNKKLSNLDWSEYDHTLNFTNIQNSWDTSIILNSVATSNFTSGVPDGFGYLYALVNYGYAANQLILKTNEILPLFYVKETMEKIFALGGYTITGDWIDSNIVKRFVYGLGGGERPTIGSSEVAARLISYTQTSAETTVNKNPYNYTQTSAYLKFNYAANNYYTISDITPFTTTLVSDTRSQFSESNGIATIGSSGVYNLSATLNFDLNAFGFTVLGVANFKTAFFKLSIVRNGVEIGSDFFNQNTIGSYSHDVNIQAQLDAGDEVEFVWQVSFEGWVAILTGNSPGILGITHEVSSGTVKIEAINQEIVDGDTVYLSNYLPDMSCRDFVKDMITMFNLYFSEPNESNEIRIESFNDYYDTTDNAENWSNILDISKTQKISSNAGIEGKNYMFKWAEDRDMYKSIYFNEFGSDYGDLNYTIPTTFKKGDKVFQVGFTQTVPIDVSGLIIPQIVKRDEQTGLQVSHKGKPRIYIYNGLPSGNWTLVNSSTGSTSSESRYPQVHHVDDVDSPTFDLNFGVPKKIYYTTTSYTTNNLFAENYDRYIKELTSSDSKIYNASFNINETHLTGEHMRRLVNVDGVVFRKNIINDFDATGYETTMVQLVKVLEANQRATRTQLSLSDVISSEPTMRVVNPTTETSTAFNTITRQDGSYVEADSSSEEITIELADDNYLGSEVTVKRIGAGFNVVVQAETGNIDGAATYTLSSNYQSQTFIFTSNGWRKKS